jgi:cell fate (sporulation/competence/biofilm development) regulator YlbF (YheA/YmcA/DUF963 family)
MDAVSRNIRILLSVVKRSEVYREYKKQEDILNKNPQLRERVDQFRADNFRLQNEAGREDLFLVAEQLSRESAELRRIPEVNAYLDAELALCKMMQRICRELTEGIDMHVPNL